MKKRFDDMKIQYKFLTIFSIVAVVMLIGNLSVFRILQKAYNKELYNKSVQLLTLFAEEVQLQLDQIVYDSESIIGNEKLQKELQVMKDSGKRSDDWLSAHRGVRETLDNTVLYSEDIKAVYLISEDKSEFAKFRSGEIISPEHKELLSESANEARGRERWVFLPEMPGTLFLTREIRDMQNVMLDRLGVLIIKINLTSIVEHLNKALLEKNAPIQVAIYQESVNIYAGSQVMSKLMPGTSDFEIYDTEDGKFFCTYHTVEGYNWTYVIATSYADIFNSVNRAVKISLFVMLCVMSLTLFVGSKMAETITKRIIKLSRQCDIFSKGEYVPLGEDGQCYNGQDEIDTLYRHFDKMAAENARMIQDTYVKQQLLLEAQVSNLKAQIRPHFIYNTLESIYCLAQIGGDERISTMTSALGKLLRTSLKEQRNVVKLKEDLKMAEEYLKIQSVRLGERLRVCIDVDEQYEEILIPFMTIQPLVENAVFYAAEEMQETCEIRLYCRQIIGFVEFVVEDNGPGMDEDIVEKLETKQIIPQGLGIGLENIDKRLKLLISKESGVFVERKEDRTLVIVRLLEESEYESIPNEVRDV